MTEELKPCLCGEPGSLRRDDYLGFWQAVCEYDGCLFGFEYLSHDKASLIKAWNNKRVSDD